MSRIVTIAQSEFLTLVKTKAFIIGIFLMPVLMGLFIFFMSYAERHADTEDRPFAVIDQTSVLYPAVAAAAERYNSQSGPDEARTGPRFLPVRVDPAGRSMDDLKVDLSEQVRARTLFAFVEIPAAIIEGGEGLSVHYYAENTSYERLPDWLRGVLNEEIAKLRFDRAGVSQALVTKLTARAPLATFGLVERTAAGKVSEAKEVNELTRVALPMFFIVLMFLSVMTSAQHLLNAIIEEKMSKISEVLLGSVTPFQLLAGKLLGVVGVSLLLALVYFGGGVYAVVSLGRFDLINPWAMGWFVVFMICASLMFGSIFLALGSACSDLKDAQSMLQPAMVLVLAAYLGSFVVMRNPESGLAVGLSFFPTMTPFVMMLRIVMPPGPPMWQVALAIAVLFASTAALIWAGGRIFRVGLLMQGKAPNLPELVKWIRL
jgi:ABC-2 type transport system permease protein